jgi:anti-repressor protein
MELGLFKVKETVVMHTNKSPEVVPTVKVTGKGQLYFIKYFLDN